MTNVGIVGRANIDGLTFYYDRRTGMQIPDSVIAKKHLTEDIDTTAEVLEIIQIDRDKDNFNIVVCSANDIRKITITYDNTNKTFSCKDYDPRKVIPAILENEDTKLYFMSRDHPYYDKSFTPNYGDDDVPATVPDRGPLGSAYLDRTAKYAFLRNLIARNKEENDAYIEATNRLYRDDLKYENINDSGTIIRPAATAIRPSDTTIRPSDTQTSRPNFGTFRSHLDAFARRDEVTEDLHDSIWDRYYQSRIQEPDSASGCDSEGCRDPGPYDPNSQITQEDIKEIEDMFGPETDDKSTRSLLNRKPIRVISRTDPFDDNLDEFTNDAPRRTSGYLPPHTVRDTSYGDLHMRAPLYKLPSHPSAALADATEEEKKLALSRYHAAKLLAELDFEKAIRESSAAYTSKLDDELELAKMMSMIPDDPIQPGLGSDSVVAVKPPKLPEREDNL